MLSRLLSWLFPSKPSNKLALAPVKSLDAGTLYRLMRGRRGW